jgi:uncharacterized protein (DUF2147 family)
MRHHVTTTAIGLLAAAVLFPMTSTEAAAADPTGIWRKADQGERPGKIQVFRCGSGKRYVCAKIVWLQDPLDSSGKPLRDVRNENPSQRGRAILGLPIINGMAPTGANQWKGSIYNPEDGNTYSATLTMVSNNQITLRGCKGWILCGERTWLRTSLPKEEPKAEEQIEASAEPEAPAETETAEAKPEPQSEPDAFANTEILTPVANTPTAGQPGYRFLNGSTAAEDHAGFTGENVPSMFVMTKPIATDADGNEVAAAESAQEPQPAAAPQPAAQPAKRTIQANAAPAPQPQSAPRTTTAPTAQPEGTAEGEPIDTAETETETAEAAVVDSQNLSRRERRMLRRQQRGMEEQSQGLLPWLR